VLSPRHTYIVHSNHHKRDCQPYSEYKVGNFLFDWNRIGCSNYLF
jgi:hypothetical protein